MLYSYFLLKSKEGANYIVTFSLSFIGIASISEFLQSLPQKPSALGTFVPVTRSSSVSVVFLTQTSQENDPSPSQELHPSTLFSKTNKLQVAKLTKIHHTFATHLSCLLKVPPPFHKSIFSKDRSVGSAVGLLFFYGKNISVGN